MPTEEKKLSEMLEELREVDPETWQTIDAYGIGKGDHPEEDFLDECIIQGCIQRAIRCRTDFAKNTYWAWEIRQDAPHPFASITIRRIEGEKCFYALLSSPAAAILAAYLAACQSSHRSDLSGQ